MTVPLHLFRPTLARRPRHPRGYPGAGHDVKAVPGADGRRVPDLKGGDTADVTGARHRDEPSVPGELSLIDQGGASHPCLADRIGVV